MTPHDEQLTPEALDKQIDRLAQAPHQPGGRQTPTTRLIQSLGRLYENERADAQSVRRVRRRLMESGAIPAAPRAGRRGPDIDRPPSGWQSFSQVPQVLPRRRWGLASRLLTIAAAIVLLAAIGGLAAGLILVRQHATGGIAVPTSIPSAVPSSCPSRATTTAEAWFPSPYGSNFMRGQIMGTINNGPITTLSDFHYPLNIPPERISTITSPFFMAWSPDARYLAVAVNAPYEDPVYAYLVDTTTHATTAIPIPTQADGSPWPGWVGGRIFAWADPQTLLLFYGGNTLANGSAGPSYSYNVKTRALTPLPGVQAAEGVVRCSTLFYLELTAPKDPSNTATGDALLHRYDLTTHRDIGQPVRLSATYQDLGAVNASLIAPAWDVSPDGTRLVYQQLESPGPYPKQEFFAANSDGTNAQVIYSPKTTYLFTFIKISPNGQFVIIGGLLITSVSITGGPVRMYGNDTAGNYGGYPGWLPDSSGFDVVNTVPTQQDFSDPFISRYLLNTPPGADGFVPGTTLVPEAQSLAVLP